MSNLFLIEANSSTPVGPHLIAPFLVVGWAYAILRGIRWVWFCTLALNVITIPGILLGSVSWEGAVVTLLDLVLLLLPATRQYFAGSSVEGERMVP
jgi:hypothetical protein